MLYLFTLFILFHVGCPCSYTPECIDKDILLKNWDNTYMVKHYDKDKCCKKHKGIRMSIESALKNYKNVYLIGGSLLGIYRHNGMQVPWEKDGDLGILYDFNFKNITDLENMIYSASSNEIEIITNSQGAKYMMKVEFENITSFVDIFIFEKTSDDTFNYVKKDWASIEPALHYDDIYPLKICNFYDTEIKCFNKGISHLKKVYGDDVMYAPPEGEFISQNMMKAHYMRLRKKEVYMLLEIFILGLIIILGLFFCKTFSKRKKIIILGGYVLTLFFFMKLLYVFSRVSLAYHKNSNYHDNANLYHMDALKEIILEYNTQRRLILK